MPFNTIVKNKFIQVFGIDVRTLALFRIGVAICILADLIVRSKDIVAFYTDQGVVPLDTIPKTLIFWSFHSINGSLPYQICLFTLAGIFAIFLLIGYKTRLSTIISWIFLISLHHRNPILLYAGDNILLLLLFWGTFLPLGARFSVDAAYNNNYQNIPQRFFSAATVGLTIQVFYIYFLSSLHKTSPVWRIDGTAINYALRISYTEKPLGIFLLRFPLLIKFLSHSVFILESIGSLLLLSPFFNPVLRIILVASFISFHLGIFMTMRLDLFPFFSIVSLLIFIPSLFWDLICKALKKLYKPVTIYYDSSCSLCSHFVRLLKQFTLLENSKTIPVLSNKSIHAKMVKHQSWIVKDDKGHFHYGFQGFIVVCKASPLLKIFTPLLTTAFISSLGEMLYRLISRNRRKCSIQIKKRKNYSYMLDYSIIFQLVGALSLFFITYLNILILNKIPIPKTVGQLSYTLGLNQGWRMYAPAPFIQNGWYTIIGTLENKKLINLLNQNAPITFNSPTSQYPLNSDRWMTFQYAISSPKFPTIVPTKREVFYRTYAVYLCKQYNSYKPNSKLVTVDIYTTTQLLDPKKIHALHKFWLISYNCFSH